MKIVIAGAGEVGVHLAKLLSKEDLDIVLIDTDVETLRWLDSNYNLMTVTGSPTSIHILEQANVSNADLFIGVMPSETRNILACQLAKHLGSRKTTNICWPKTANISRRWGSMTSSTPKCWLPKKWLPP